MHNVDPLVTEIKAVLEKIDGLLGKFADLCQAEKNVRKTYFYKARHAITHVERQKVQIQQLLHRFVHVLLQLVSSRNLPTIEGGSASDWHFALECVDSFNKVTIYEIPPFF